MSPRAKRVVNSTVFNIIALGVLSAVVIVVLIIALVAQARAASAAKTAAAAAKTAASLANAQAIAAKHEQVRLQGALCGLVVPIGLQTITAHSSDLAHAVIVGARHSVQVIPCQPQKKGN